MTKNREPLQLLPIYDQGGFAADLNCREAAYLKLSVQLTARAVPFWLNVVELIFIAFIEVSENSGCP